MQAFIWRNSPFAARANSRHAQQMLLDGPILAIESSCDDCGAAVVNVDGTILADVVFSQTGTHSPFGGIVPEHASRQHLATVASVVMQALSDAKITPSQLGAVAVTYGPGLVGSLLVGVQFARGFATAAHKTLIGIHHVEGHLFAGRADPEFPQEPFVGLIAAGGHTALYLCRDDAPIEFLGETRDDAAGEAYDKIAKMLGYSYPGGQKVDELAQHGDPKRFVFPVALKGSQNVEYSFSGLKTSFRLKLAELKASQEVVDDKTVADLCAGVQKAIVQALLDKAFLACQKTGARHLVIGGGVACNSLLRSEALRRGRELRLRVFLTPKKHCTDNAAMIGQAALRRIKLGRVITGDFAVRSTSDVDDPV
jgi:N6-L-threonylcarbamoyladenine synthase